jgi:hypothetical protein
MDYPERLGAEYVLPIRMDQGELDHELRGYLRRLSGWLDITVVDGSADDVFGRNARACSGLARHVHPDPVAGGNGKTAGVLTGIRLSRHEIVVIGDDDVRYTYSTLKQVVSALGSVHVVRPQNYFLERTWHTQWDTARTLVNRAFGSDYPGTLGVRRSIVMAAGGYDPDVLFENLELLRTIRAAGGVELRADDLFVGRRAPTVKVFLTQRPRQAYDDFAQPVRLVVELCLVAVVGWSLKRPSNALLLAGAACAVAAAGRARAHGRDVFPATSVLWAPVWVAERAVCVWIAVASRSRGGVIYRGRRFKRAATPMRVLRRLHLAARSSSGAAMGHAADPAARHGDALSAVPRVRRKDG